MRPLQSGVSPRQPSDPFRRDHHVKTAACLAVSLIFLTQIAGNGAGTKPSESPIMRRVLFGLMLTSLVTCSAFAGDASNADPNGPQQARKPSPPVHVLPKNNKQTSKAQSDERSRLDALAPAAAYASEHSVNLPISSAPKPTPSSTRPWTGFYVGAGAGVGSSQP
jgi:hypothetical protein